MKNRKLSRDGLSRLLGSHLNCSPSTIKQILQGKREYYPIPVILELIKLSSKKRKFLHDFKQNIKSLKINSASSRSVKATSVLSENLAKILGAFMADGSLSLTHYNIELIDEYKDSVEAFIRWINEEFRVSPTSLKRKKNAWRVIFSNKILARYLTSFFEVNPGPKTFDAFEPKIIKTSSLKIRKNFARGALMFDGCVTISKKIMFSSKSKILIESIKEIWSRDSVHFGMSFSSNRNETNLFTTSKNRKEKLQSYFEKNTQKWKLFKWISGDLTQSPVIKSKSSASYVEKTLEIIRKAKYCDTFFIKKSLRCNHTTARNYLKILRDQKRIKLTNKPNQITQYISPKATLILRTKAHNFIFTKIKKEYGTYKSFSGILNIKKATFSRWRVKKSGIPIHILKLTCQILNVDFKKMRKGNIKKIDREIAEII
ncbi:MAG: hypothetical protein NTZ42_03630 [Candidatus Gribaldobacteria bacterium]|nr:hypothetical protein [Candidatus Gribaldobacteria bacterium]